MHQRALTVIVLAVVILLPLGGMEITKEQYEELQGTLTENQWSGSDDGGGALAHPPSFAARPTRRSPCSPLGT